MRTQNNILNKRKFLIIILFLIFSWSYKIYIVYSDQNEAKSNLDIAINFIEINYRLIKFIEKSDVNISEHVFELNKAINYYEDSKMEYSKTNYTGSIIISKESIIISKQLNEILSEIRIMFLEKNNFSFTISMSTRILLLIMVGLFFYYLSKLLKQKHYNDLLKMKPKVNLNEH
jgi:hypothetical protein